MNPGKSDDDAIFKVPKSVVSKGKRMPKPSTSKPHTYTSGRKRERHYGHRERHHHSRVFDLTRQPGPFPIVPIADNEKALPHYNAGKAMFYRLAMFEHFTAV